MKKAGLLEIYKIFFIIGLQLLGGGYVIVPLLKKYIVEGRKWLTEDELTDFFAMSQCIPGIIAGNIAVIAGMRVKGIPGAIASIAGIITPCFFAILLFAHIMKNIIHFNIVQNAFWGIRISVIVLVIITIKDLWKKSVNSLFSYIMFFCVSGAILLFPVSPSIIIILAGLTSYLYLRRKENA